MLGKVTKVERDHVELDYGQGGMLHFDFCIIAMGSSYSSLIKTQNASLEHRKQELMQQMHLNDDADTILVVGGGVIGCEYAGELA